MKLTDLVGLWLTPHTVGVERDRLRRFASAIGESDPVYTDLAAARAAGHHDLLVPPTFLVGLEFERPGEISLLAQAGVDPLRVRHVEQALAYHTACYAGDTLTFTGQITDVYTRRGAMRFVVRESTARRADGERIADLKLVVAVLPAVAAAPEVAR